MSDKSNYDDGFMNDSSWASLFEMAESFEEQEDLPVYETVSFYESSVVKEETYHTPEEVLKVLFGYDSFRTGQKQVIDEILSGRDVCAVMPTGAGKSVCYQVPAMLLPGITLVISPLLSLMQDQVKALNEAGVSAAFINSSLSENAFYETVRKARQGLYKIIYVAPERLGTEVFLELAHSIPISMVTVDEAHCISQWGQDFRPSYMKIVEFIKTLEKRPILSAFTATATETVREDIVCILGLNKPYVLVTGFNRDNLFFQVDKPKSKEQYVMDYILKHPAESGIVYCATRKNVDSLYEVLKSRGVSVAKYHAGMGTEERKKMQDDFVFDYTNIIVATNAFGMGIDKSNVRFVIHYNMPQSMENYYQEAGRAGRDGLNAKCILLFSPQDIIINRFLLERKEMMELDPLEREVVKERDIKRLQVMERYCYTTECLRNYILNYFGENPEKPCEDCSNCLREFKTLDMTDAAKKIINCVYEAKGRYGKGIIIDTVVGAKTAKLEEIGAVDYKSYGVLAQTNKNLLKRLVEQLVLEGYLLVGDYQVLKLGDIIRLKNPDMKVLVKITDEDKLPEKETKTKTKSKGIEFLTSAGAKLFDKFRTLRLEIAREEGVPPYIIFSDKTLIDMAAKVPTSKSEMLDVSGVGENKWLKYGERFLSLIEVCIGEFPELIQNKKEISQQDESDIKIKRKKQVGKQEFFLFQEEADNFMYSDFLYISDIRDEMNRICVRDNRKKVSATKLIELLLEEGVIEENEADGRYGKIPTEKGLKFGIKVTDKVSERGNAYTVLMYPKIIQQILVEKFVRKMITEEIDGSASYKYELHAHTSECDPYARLSARELVHLYKNAGYDGMVITDHYMDLFYTQWFTDELEGLSHEEQVKRWLKGFYTAKEEGDKIGFTVLPGAEVRFNGYPNDYLIYGLQEDFFYTVPRLNELQNLNELLAVLPPDVCVVQAHPFRDEMMVANPKGLFGIEVYNGGTEKFRNEIARQFASHYNLAMTSGSDIHGMDRLAKGGIMTTVKIETPEDLIAVLRSGEYALVEKD